MRIDGHLDLERDLPAGGGHGPAGTGHRRLEAEEVVHGLDEQEVHPAVEERGDLAAPGIFEMACDPVDLEVDVFGKYVKQYLDRVLPGLVGRFGSGD